MSTICHGLSPQAKIKNGQKNVKKKYLFHKSAVKIKHFKLAIREIFYTKSGFHFFLFTSLIFPVLSNFVNKNLWRYKPMTIHWTDSIEPSVAFDVLGVQKSYL